MWEDIDTDAIDERLIEEAVYAALNKLPTRHALAVMLRNGFDCTYNIVGAALHVSAARARELNAKAIRVLKFKHKNFFTKLDLPFVNKYYRDIELEEWKRKEELKRWQIDRDRKQHEKAVQAEIERKARAKLKLVESEIPKAKAVVKPYSPKPPFFPPFFVKLLYNDLNEPYLHVDVAYGLINRDLDPETYDKWLEYLIFKEKQATGIPVQRPHWI